MSQEGSENPNILNRNWRNGSLLSKVYSECKIFSSIVFILDKLENDGYFERIQSCLQSIFDKEMAFAVSELRKIKTKKKKFDIRNQLVNNTFIFKENLKLIAGSLVDTLWNEKIKPDTIDLTISQAQLEINRGSFEEIEELCEEEEAGMTSDCYSQTNIVLQEVAGDAVEVEDFHEFHDSYGTEVESRDFRFGSGDNVAMAIAKPQKVVDSPDHYYETGENRSYTIDLGSDENSRLVKEGVKSEQISRMMGKPSQEHIIQRNPIVSMSLKDFRKNKDRKLFEMQESIDIDEPLSKDWEQEKLNKVIEQRTDKSRLSVSMGNLTLNDTQGDDLQITGLLESHLKETHLTDKESWKRTSGLNMYLNSSQKEIESEKSSDESKSLVDSYWSENKSKESVAVVQLSKDTNVQCSTTKQETPTNNNNNDNNNNDDDDDTAEKKRPSKRLLYNERKLKDKLIRAKTPILSLVKDSRQESLFEAKRVNSLTRLKKLKNQLMVNNNHREKTPRKEKTPRQDKSPRLEESPIFKMISKNNLIKARQWNRSRPLMPKSKLQEQRGRAMNHDKFRSPHQILRNLKKKQYHQPILQQLLNQQNSP